MPFIDFGELKERVRIEDAIPKLGLHLKQRNGQWRGPCPVCQTGGDRALVVTPAKQAFYCFGGKTGGDVIALVAHIRDCGMKEAADFLLGTVRFRQGTVPVPGTVPRQFPRRGPRRPPEASSL